MITRTCVEKEPWKHNSKEITLFFFFLLRGSDHAISENHGHPCEMCVGVLSNRPWWYFGDLGRTSAMPCDEDPDSIRLWDVQNPSFPGSLELGCHWPWGSTSWGSQKVIPTKWLREETDSSHWELGGGTRCDKPVGQGRVFWKVVLFCRILLFMGDWN